MKKILIALLLATPAAALAAVYEGVGGGGLVRSQSVDAPSPAATAWAGAIGQSLRRLGPEGVDALGFNSLAYLAQPLSASSLMIDAHPEYAARLAAEFAANGWTPEKLAEAPLDVQRRGLRAVANNAGNRVGRELLRLYYPEGEASDADSAVLERAEKAAKLLAEDRAFLSAKDLEFFDLLSKRAAVIKSERAAKMAEFSRRLPTMIANGEITGKNLLFTDGRKWGLADEGPVPAYGTVDETVRARALAIAGAPIGPWSEDLYASLREASSQGVIKEAARDPEALARVVHETAEAISLFSEKRLKRRIGAFYLSAAIAAGRTPSARLIAETEKRYLDALNDPANTDVTRQAILKTFRNGDGFYFPAWAQFKQAKKQALARLRRLSNVFTATTLGAAIALLSSGLVLTAHPSSLWLFPVIAVVGLISIIGNAFVGARRRLLRDTTLEGRMADYERTSGRRSVFHSGT